MIYGLAIGAVIFGTGVLIWIVYKKWKNKSESLVTSLPNIRFSDCKVVIRLSMFNYYVRNFIFRYILFGALYDETLGSAATLKLFFLNLYTADSAQTQTHRLYGELDEDRPFKRYRYIK